MVIVLSQIVYLFLFFPHLVCVLVYGKNSNEPGLKVIIWIGFNK